MPDHVLDARLARRSRRDHRPTFVVRTTIWHTANPHSPTSRSRVSCESFVRRPASELPRTPHSRRRRLATFRACDPPPRDGRDPIPPAGPSSPASAGTPRSAPLGAARNSQPEPTVAALDKASDPPVARNPLSRTADTSRVPSAEGANAATNLQSTTQTSALESRLLLSGAAVGGVTGLAVVAFKRSIEAMQSLLYGDAVAGNLFPTFGSTTFAVIPLIGGVAVALLRFTAGHPFSGGLSDSIARPTARVDLTKPAQKTAASVLTLGSGNSLGPEQGAVDIGAVLAMYIGQTMRLAQSRQDLLLAAGAASGLAAGFNAPIAGVFFALERLRIGPRIGSGGVDAAVVLLSTSISALVAQAGLGATPAFSPPLYDIREPLLELPMWLILGGLCGGASVAFRTLLGWSDAFFNKSAIMARIPRALLPVLGSAFCAAVALRYPQVLFFGYDTLSSLLADDSAFTLRVLFVLLVVKPITTAVCLGSGLVGGTVAPSMFLGAVVGAAFEKASVAVLQALSHSPFSGLVAGVSIAGAPAYSMIGMAAVLGGILRAPLTSSLLLFELTRDYRIVVPLIAAAGISSALANYRLPEDEKASEPKPTPSAELKSTVTTQGASVSAGGIEATPEQDMTEPESVAIRERVVEPASTGKSASEEPDEYDDTDKAIELGRALRTSRDLALNGVVVEDPRVLEAATTLDASVPLLDIVSVILDSECEVAIVVRTPDHKVNREASDESGADPVAPLDAGTGIATDDTAGVIGLLTIACAEQAIADGRKSASVGSVVGIECVTVRAGTPVTRALDLMVRFGAEHAVVVDDGGADGKPIGVLTATGVGRFAARELLLQTIEAA